MTPSALSPPFGRFRRWFLPNFERPPAAMVPVPATNSEAVLQPHGEALPCDARRGRSRRSLLGGGARLREGPPLTAELLEGPGNRAVTMEAEGMAPPKPPPDLI